MANTTIKTPESLEAFLESLSGCGNVSVACAEAGISRSNAYRWRAEDAEFAQAWSDAQELGTDALEDEATRRASQGTDEPVFYQGVACGAVRKYSDSLMMFMLKARRPEKFKDRSASEITGAGGAPLLQIYLPGNGRDQPATAVEEKDQT